MTHTTPQPAAELSDANLRAYWRQAGGRFHGPNVETGTMPEAQLLPLLRSLLAGPATPQPQALPELPEPAGPEDMAVYSAIANGYFRDAATTQAVGDDERKFVAMRLRRVCRAAGLGYWVAFDDDEMLGRLFSILGEVARRLESTAKQARAALASQPPAPADAGRVVPKGWRLVPEEPTQDMLGAGRVNLAYRSCSAEQVWAAMLAAAPQPEPAVSTPAQPAGEAAAWEYEYFGNVGDGPPGWHKEFDRYEPFNWRRRTDIRSVRALTYAPPAPPAVEPLTVQEAWEAAGGNPGIKATKAELLQALRMLDEAVDEAPAVEPAETQWLPIESAPKDGTAVLLVSVKANNPGADIGHWSDEDRCFRFGYADEWASMAARGLKAWHDLATHWMPLPAPPAPTLSASAGASPSASGDQGS